MKFLEIVFFVLLFSIFYSYIAYGLILFFIVKIKKVFSKRNSNVQELADSDLPEITLIIAAYNEKDYIEEKLKNSFDLDYPKGKLKHVWITDGSNDGSEKILAKYENIELFHLSERNGKIAAMNRGMKFVKTPIVVFSDCNTNLSKSSIRIIANLFHDKKVGCVAGEKRIYKEVYDGASGSGEGFYWKYESALKKIEAEFNSVVGAAGELFAIRTCLFEEVEKDTLLDDFIISLRIAKQGYTVQYNPEAYAIETASLNVKEELKRKVRIAAGSLQTIFRLPELLNPFKYKILSFQYISHKVLRWTICPLSMIILLPLNVAIVYLKKFDFADIYTILLLLQMVFYLFTLLGWIFSNKKLRLKILFIPYYFFVMNFSIIQGAIKYLMGKQSVNWEKAKRQQKI